MLCGEPKYLRPSHAAILRAGLGKSCDYNALHKNLGLATFRESEVRHSLQRCGVNAPSQSALQSDAEMRLGFEMLLADVCAQFVNVAPAELDSKIENAQRVICEALGVDHSSVWQVSEGNPDAFLMTHAYRDPNLRPLPSQPFLKTYFPWSLRKILAKETVCIPNAEDVPPEAATDKESWLQYDTRSALAFHSPLAVER